MDGGLVIGIILNKHLHRTFGMTLLPFAYFLSWWSQKGRFASFVISGCSLFWCQGLVLFFIIKKIVGSRPRLPLDLLSASHAKCWSATGYKHIAGSVLLLGHLTNHLASVPMTFFLTVTSDSCRRLPSVRSLMLFFLTFKRLVHIFISSLIFYVFIYKIFVDE